MQYIRSWKADDYFNQTHTHTEGVPSFTLIRATSAHAIKYEMF